MRQGLSTKEERTIPTDRTSKPWRRNETPIAVLETENRYHCPEPNRGKRNDSSQIRYVIDKIAAIRGILPEEVEKQTEINARNMYGLLQ